MILVVLSPIVAVLTADYFISYASKILQKRVDNRHSINAKKLNKEKNKFHMLLSIRNNRTALRNAEIKSRKEVAALIKNIDRNLK